MPNTNKIDEVVDSAAVAKQLGDLQAQSKAAREEFMLLLKTTNDLNNALGKTTTTKAFKQAATEAEASANKIVAAQNRVTKAEVERQRLEEKRRRIVREGTADDLARAQSQRNETQAVTQNTAALAANEATMRRNNAAEIQGEQAAARYRQARLSALAATESDTAAIAQNTAATAANTAAQSGGLANIGRGLTRGLGYLRTLAYVLPGIGIAGIFTLAFEGITALSKALFDGGDALDLFKTKYTAFVDAFGSTEFKKAAADIYELNTNFNLAREGVIDKDAVLKEYNDTLGSTIGFTDDFNTAEKLTLERGPKVLQLLTLKIAAQNLLTKAAEKTAEKAIELNKTDLESASFLDRLKGGFSFKQFGTLPGLFESTKEYNARVAKLTLEDQKKLGADRRKVNADNLEKERQQLVKAFSDLQTEAAKFAKDNGLSLLGNPKPEKEKKKKDTSEKDELTALEYQYNQQIELARAKDKENLELEKEYGKQLENYRKEVFERLRDEANMDYAQRILANDQAKNADLTALAGEYEQGLIKTKEYNERKNEIEQGYAQEAIKQQLQLAGDLIQVKKDQGEDTAKDEIELAKLQIRLSELVTAKKLSDLEKQKAKQAEINAAIKNLAEGAANFVIALVDAGFTNRKNQIAAEKDENDKRTQQEIDAVDRSLGTEQEKADKIAVIKAKQQSQNEAFARQQKKIDVEKAKFDKAVSIARIIENTAVGITSALAQFPPNVPLSILIGALGAVQLGTVLAQPIPQYAKGTKNAKGGLSIIGEEGAEKVDLPNGKSFISASTAQLINLPAGAKVTPHGETMRMIGRPDDLQRFTGGQMAKWDEVIAELRQNRPQKNKNNINIRIDGSFEKYRQNHFK